MFSWLTNPNILLGGLILAAVQVLAALPWLRTIDSRSFDKAVRNLRAYFDALQARPPASGEALPEPGPQAPPSSDEPGESDKRFRR